MNLKNAKKSRDTAPLKTQDYRRLVPLFAVLRIQLNIILIQSVNFFNDFPNFPSVGRRLVKVILRAVLWSRAILPRLREKILAPVPPRKSRLQLTQAPKNSL